MLSHADSATLCRLVKLPRPATFQRQARWLLQVKRLRLVVSQPHLPRRWLLRSRPLWSYGRHQHQFQLPGLLRSSCRRW